MNTASPGSPEHTTQYYENISPTAFVIAYERTFSDIPLSNEVYEALRGVELEGKLATQDASISRLAPRYEGRYKLVNKLLDESLHGSVLEIAPGMSPRGLSYTRAHPELTYVELDLPHISDIKKRVIHTVDDALGQSPSSLILMDGNALEREAINSAAAMTEKAEPLAVINEGLMRYLNFAEKHCLAENILAVLNDRGGVWITPDITLKSFNTGIMKVLETRVADISGVDLSQNYFDDVAQAREFYEAIGFEVEVRGFLEVKNDISSAAVLGMEQAEVDALLSQSVAFVLRPRQRDHAVTE